MDTISNQAPPGLGKIFSNNRKWAEKRRLDDPQFFHKLATAQKPQFLWIGCADSRVSANEIMGLPSGEVFVHRNVANLVSLTDFNCLSVVQFAVEVLQVRHILVCGHYGCGGILAALQGVEIGMVNNWLSPVDNLNRFFDASLPCAKTALAARADKLCELNVVSQVQNLARCAQLRSAWAQGQALSLHGLIYMLEDGILRDLGICIQGSDDVDAICANATSDILATHNRVVLFRPHESTANPFQ